MPDSALLKIIIREIFTTERSQRIPEPDLVMDDPAKVDAYTRAGREDGVAAAIYLFHAAQVSEVIKPGDTVVDFGCGPATQLGLIAKLNPETHFIGIDLSPEMLVRGHQYLKDQGITNVELVEGDITSLKQFNESSVDAVISTMTLHHLPNIDFLDLAFGEAARILKQGGGLYFVDFGRMKSEKSMQALAYRHKDRQAELFTLDYFYSLKAAFQSSEFNYLTDKHFTNQAVVKKTFLVPLLVTVKSNTRADLGCSKLREKFKLRQDALPDFMRRELADLKTFFRMGGVKSPLLE